MRVAAIGNCQMLTIGECLADLVPHASVTTIFTGFFTHEQRDSLLATLPDYDHVFTQPFAFGEAGLGPVRDKARRLHVLPSIVFTGFHPDVVLMPGIRSPTGSSHRRKACARS